MVPASQGHASFPSRLKYCNDGKATLSLCRKGSNSVIMLQFTYKAINLGRCGKRECWVIRLLSKLFTVSYIWNGHTKEYEVDKMS